MSDFQILIKRRSRPTASVVILQPKSKSTIRSNQPKSKTKSKSKTKTKTKATTHSKQQSTT